MTAHTVPTNEGGPKNKLIKRRFTRVYIERAVPAAAIKVEKKSEGGRRRCRGSRDRISHSLPPFLPLVDRTMPFRFIALHLSPRLTVCGKRVVMGVAGALKLRKNPRRFKRRLCGSVHMHALAALQEMESDGASKRL